MKENNHEIEPDQTTARPWDCDFCFDEFSAKIEIFSDIDEFVIGAVNNFHDGKLIVRAVNAHDALVEALERILEMVPPCNCHEDYTSRGLIAPDCQYHKSGMEEIEAYAVEGLAALKIAS